nr:MAG TPA: hypothetical protein [Bacteriophage sp.]
MLIKNNYHFFINKLRIKSCHSQLLYYLCRGLSYESLSYSSPFYILLSRPLL